MAKSWKQYKEQFKDDPIWAWAMYLADGDTAAAEEWLAWYDSLDDEGKEYNLIDWQRVVECSDDGMED